MARERVSGKGTVLREMDVIAEVEYTLDLTRNYETLNDFGGTERIEGFPTIHGGQITSGPVADGHYTIRLQDGTNLHCDLQGNQIYPR